MSVCACTDMCRVYVCARLCVACNVSVSPRGSVCTHVSDVHTRACVCSVYSRYVCLTGVYGHTQCAQGPVGLYVNTYVHVCACVQCAYSPIGFMCTHVSGRHTHTHMCLCAVCAHMCVCAVRTYVSMHALRAQPYGCVCEHACTRTCSLHIRVCVSTTHVCAHEPIGLCAR